MGLWSLPHPTEGMLCILMVNISIFKDFVRSIIPLSSSSSSSPPPLTSSENPSSELFDFPHCHSDSFLEEFRNRTPTLRFGSICNCNNQSDYDHDHDHDHECSVCLTKFEPESEINGLGCGHSFHKFCLEKWIDYWNMTCPLCRASLVI